MTLADIFKPNNYGTRPTLDIVGVGSITYYNDKVALALRTESPNIYVPLSTQVDIANTAGNRLELIDTELCVYTIYVSYLKLADAAEQLTINAIDPEHPLHYMTSDGVIRTVGPVTRNSIRILANGTGWVNEHPVTFYYEDILYRLDLRDQLK